MMLSKVRGVSVNVYVWYSADYLLHIIVNISFMSGLANEEVSVSVKCGCVQK